MLIKMADNEWAAKTFPLIIIVITKYNTICVALDSVDCYINTSVYVPDTNFED